MHLPAVVAAALGACFGYWLCARALQRVVEGAALHQSSRPLPHAVMMDLMQMTMITLFCEIGCAGAAVALVTGRPATGFMTAMITLAARMLFIVSDKFHFRGSTAALCGALGALVACQ